MLRDDNNRKDLITDGFHWAVMLPILDDSNSLDVWVIELNRYKPGGYTLTKILFDWRTLINEYSWKSFVIF